MPRALLPAPLRAGRHQLVRLNAADGRPAGVYFVLDLQAAEVKAGGTGAQFEDVTASDLPQRMWTCSAVATGDFDGDGRPDMAFSAFGSNCDSLIQYPFRLWMQAPWRGFVDETESRVALSHPLGYDLLAFDADGDGDLDLFGTGLSCGNGNTWVASLYVNDGHGRFTDQSEARLSAAPNTVYAVFASAADFDGDGSDDLALTTYDGSTALVWMMVWMNDGTGHFHDAPERLPPPGISTFPGVTAADVTGDGAVDLLFTTVSDGSIALFRNRGDGTFVDETADRIPAGLRDDREVVAADVDRDGDADLLEVGFPFEINDPKLRLLLNDGAGHFAAEIPSGLDTTSAWINAARFGDFDGNGAPDLFLACVGPGEFAADQLYLNDGLGGFVNHDELLPGIIDFSVDAALFDADGDADLDIAIANSGPSEGSPGQNRLYRSALEAPSPAPDGPHGVAELAAVTPNPSVSNVRITVALARAAETRLVVYDIRGRRVRELVRGTLSAGMHDIGWDGRDDNGDIAPSGLYFCRVAAEGNAMTRRFSIAH